MTAPPWALQQCKGDSKAGASPEEGQRETLKTDIFVNAKKGLPPGESWRDIPRSVSLPDECNPVSEIQVLGASGSQDRREAPPPGICDVVPRENNCNYTGVGRASSKAFARSTAPRAGRSATWTYGGDSGDVGHQPAATGVVGWTDAMGHEDRHLNSTHIPKEEKRIELFDASPGDKTRRPSSSKGKVSHRQPRCTGSSFRGVSDRKGVFETVLSSMQEEKEGSLRAGLKEIKTNPTDILRHTYVEIKPSGHLSTALRCHLVRGWKEQKAGHLERVRAKIAQARRVMITESTVCRTDSGKKLATCLP